MSSTSAFPQIIAVDGPAAAGKTTTSLALANLFRMRYLESGRTYRILAFEAISQRIELQDQTAIIDLCDNLLRLSSTENLLESSRYVAVQLRSQQVTKAVSDVAKIAALRSRITRLVRTWAENVEKCIVEGRDIGTVVFPSATVKFFLTASAEARAERRVAQERTASYESVLADIVRRDHADVSRAASPLVAADDAITIDTTNLTVEDVLARMSRVCLDRGLVAA